MSEDKVDLDSEFISGTTQRQRAEANAEAAVQAFAGSFPSDMYYAGKFGQSIKIAFGAEQILTDSLTGRSFHSIQYPFSVTLTRDSAREIAASLQQLVDNWKD